MFRNRIQFTELTYRAQGFLTDLYTGIQTRLSTSIYGQTGIPTTHGITTTGLFDPTTMEPDTYLNTMQSFGTPSALTSTQSPIGQQGAVYSSVIPQPSFQTTAGSTLSNIATMSPDVYMSSREQLARSAPNLQQIGQQAGIAHRDTSSTAPRLERLPSST